VKAFEEEGAATDSLPVALQQTARTHPDRTALIAGEHTMTWAEVAGAVEALAAGLMELGIRPGDSVALVLPNCPQFVLSYMATVRLGARVVPINPVLAPEEAIHIAGDSGSRAVIALEPTAPLAVAAAGACDRMEHLIVSGEELPDAAVDFHALMAADTTSLPDPPDAGEVAALLYTSGTTGRPKGAQLTHANLVSNASASIEAVDMGEDDIFLGVLPLFHAFGATVNMVIPVVVGATVVLVPRFEPLPVVEEIERTHATIFCGVPSMFAVLAALKTERSPDLSSLRLCISGGAALPRELTPIIEERYETTLLEGYGPTEASPVVSVNRTRESRKIGSVGPPLPGVEVEIRDESGQRMKVGEIGEICVRGPNVMLGYWQDPEKTANTIRDGWLYTGDLGHVDEDGYIYIVDRKTDMIIVGGLNVYSREVEDVIRLLPEVRDVAVVSCASRLRGEVVGAFIEVHEGHEADEQRIIEHCSEHLARYKVPRQIHFMRELPRSAIGKVLKRELRGRFSLH